MKRNELVQAAQEILTDEDWSYTSSVRAWTADDVVMYLEHVYLKAFWECGGVFNAGIFDDPIATALQRASERGIPEAASHLVIEVVASATKAAHTAYTTAL